MKKIVLWVDLPYLKNEIFNRENKVLNRDDCLYPFIRLKEKFAEKNIELTTQDKVDLKNVDGIIYSDLPNLSEVKKLENIDKYLIIFESEIIKPQNWIESNHRAFRKIFTWNDNLLKQKKYFKTNFSMSFDYNFEFKPFAVRSTFCSLIAGNKFVSHPLELYSERIKTIRWFEKNHPDDFALYGIGWDKVTFKGLLRPLNRVKSLRSLLGKGQYPSYKGMVDSKNETLANSKFCICYENARDIPGYITEKIFDCFFAGCIPVYWGVSNADEKFPEGSFIDRRKFNTHDELYKYLKEMSEEEYTKRQSVIKKYCLEHKTGEFSAEFFATQISENIIHE